ncbi:MAG: hypothetical protein GXP45_03300, partial [bacterium]|nr:hypothetical protein [bacterium]
MSIAGAQNLVQQQSRKTSNALGFGAEAVAKKQDALKNRMGIGDGWQNTWT